MDLRDFVVVNVSIFYIFFDENGMMYVLVIVNCIFNEDVGVELLMVMEGCL